jgi:RNA polymerase sigma-70 factor (ECF subfamily)
MAGRTGALGVEDRDDVAALLADAEPALRRLARRLCASDDDAADLVQDTFERAMRGGVPRGLRSPRAWLTRIMHNRFVDRCRSARNDTQPLEDSYAEVVQLEPDGSEPAWGKITVDDVRAALDQLEPVYREVYQMRVFEGLSYEAIAERVSIARLTVGTRLSRARKRLREVLIKRFGLEVPS